MASKLAKGGKKLPTFTDEEDEAEMSDISDASSVRRPLPTAASAAARQKKKQQQGPSKSTKRARRASAAVPEDDDDVEDYDDAASLDDFIARDDDEEEEEDEDEADNDSEQDNDDDNEEVSGGKRQRGAATSTAAGKAKRKTGVKVLAECNIPPKPSSMSSASSSSAAKAASSEEARKFLYQIELPNAAALLRFLVHIVHEVPELRFHLTHTDEFKGVRIETHDACVSVADKSRYACTIVPGTHPDGTPMTATELNRIVVCVNSEEFALCLKCASDKDSVLRITQFHNSADRPSASDELRFETVADEGESCGIFYCKTIAQEDSTLTSLDGLSIPTCFHFEINLHAIKAICSQAKAANATTVGVQLASCRDPTDPNVVHNRLAMGFEGRVTGQRVFYAAMRAVPKGVRADGKTITDWEPIANIGYAERLALPFAVVSRNEYEARKLRVFMKNMEGEWALIHLGKGLSPLLVEITIADMQTKHTIMIAPKNDGSGGDAPSAAAADAVDTPAAASAPATTVAAGADAAQG